MEHKILQSVIKITKQRDVDSLEYSLVATLAEVIPANWISVYKLIDDGFQSTLEKSLSLTIEQHKDKSEAIWSPSPTPIKKDGDILNCLETGMPVRFTKENRLNRLLMPILCEHKVIAALEIVSSEDLQPMQKVLEAVIRIYENYLFILNESERDKLTGLFNRRTFDKKLDRLLQIQRNKQLRVLKDSILSEKRSIKPYSEAWLAIIDIDHFKQVNDEFGHVFGDGVLLLLAHKMKQCFRNSDYLFRFGGEEFVVILEPHPEEMAFSTLERFRESVASHTFPLVGKVTVSVGYAKITDSDYPPAILHSADKALYYAKEHGRNCVYSYEALLTDGLIAETHLGTSIGA